MRYAAFILAVVQLTGGAGERASDDFSTGLARPPETVAYEVSGIVRHVGHAGTPIAGATITFRTPSAVRSAPTDADGEFMVALAIHPDTDCRWFGPEGRSVADFQAPASFVVEADGYATYRGWLRLLCLVDREQYHVDVSARALRPEDNKARMQVANQRP